MKLNHKTSMSLAAAMGALALATSANAAIISTSDSGGTFTITTNIALTPLGTVATDGFGAWGDPGTKLNDGTWAWASTDAFHSDDATHPTRIWITWAQDYEIDKIGLVHAEAGAAFVNADYLLQSLNSGADPTLDASWTTIDSVTGNTIVYPEYTIDPVTTSGIRLYITNPGTFSDQLARFEEILVQGTAVPEPTTTALFGLGGLALILRRRK